MNEPTGSPEDPESGEGSAEERGKERPVRAAPVQERAVTRAGLLMHLVLAVGLSTLVHVLLALRLDASTAEAWRALAAGEGAWSLAKGPLSTFSIALGMSIIGATAPAIRAANLLLWAALPLLVAAGSWRLGGRAAAVKGAWLICALPLAHASGIFAGPGVLLALAFALASLILVGMARRLRPEANAGAAIDGGLPLGAGDGALLGLVGALAVLAAPSGWLLPLAAVATLALMWPGLDSGRRLSLLAPVIAIPLAGFIFAALLLGDLGWAWRRAPLESAGHAIEVLPLLRLPHLLFALLIGAGPLALLALFRWGSWARSPSLAPPRRLARGLLLLGGVPFCLLLAISSVVPIDPVELFAPLVPFVVGVSAWRGARSWFSGTIVTSLALTVLGLLHLFGSVSLLPSGPDPADRLRGWAEAGEGVAIWCGTMPDEGHARVLAPPALAARLVLAAPSCEPIGLIDGPPELARSAPALGELVLLVHLAGEVPKMPEPCAPGAFAAPAGPEWLNLVVRPSRCGETPRLED